MLHISGLTFKLGDLKPVRFGLPNPHDLYVDEVGNLQIAKDFINSPRLILAKDYGDFNTNNNVNYTSQTHNKQYSKKLFKLLNKNRKFSKNYLTSTKKCDILI